jgi:hypothetical protein
MMSYSQMVMKTLELTCDVARCIAGGQPTDRELECMLMSGNDRQKLIVTSEKCSVWTHKLTMSQS